MTKNKISNLIVMGIMVFISPVFFTSCNKDDTSAKENDARIKLEKLKAANGMTSADSIGYGVYRQFTELDNPNDTSRPGVNDDVLISFTGYYSDGSIIETSDSLTAKQKNIYHNDIIYGPTKYYLGGLIPGIRLTLLGMPPNSAVNIVIPADMAYGNYDPVRYIIKLHKIIKDEIQFEKDQRAAYKKAIGFSGTFNSDSSIEYRILQKGTVNPDLAYYKKVSIELHAYYAEWIDGLLTRNPGRQFFPINNSADTLTYYYQYTSNYQFTTGFPITSAIDSMVATMKINEERECIATSASTYSETGYAHPLYNFNIVPSYTSIHYFLKLNRVY